jgi:hypothetical protein
MPPLRKSDKVDHDMEFEWLLCLASRRQICLRLWSTEVGGLQRPEESPHYDQQIFHREPERALNFGQEVSQPQAREWGVSHPLGETQS